MTNYRLSEKGTAEATENKIIYFGVLKRILLNPITRRILFHVDGQTEISQKTGNLLIYKICRTLYTGTYLFFRLYYWRRYQQRVLILLNICDILIFNTDLISIMTCLAIGTRYNLN
jgi:hypothetical protein